MGEAFHQGGWGMYPTTIVGLVVIFTAFRYMRDPDRRRLAVIRAFSVVARWVVSCAVVGAGSARAGCTTKHVS